MPERTLFGVLLAICTALSIAPLWLGFIPPLTDFGGHAIMVEAWERLGRDDAGMLGELFERRTGLLVPNAMMVRLGALLVPWLSPLDALRVVLSGAVLAQVGAIALLLRTFDRSPWQIFAALPFIWNGIFGLGVVNFSAALPFLVLSLLAAYRVGHAPTWRNVALLAGLSVVTFFFHAVAALFLLLLAPVALAVAVQSRTALLRGALALVPLAAVFGAWVLGVGGEDPTGGGPKSSRRLLFFPVWRRFYKFFRDGIDVMVDRSDDVIFFGLFAVLVAALWLGRRSLDAARTPSSAAAAAERGRVYRWAVAARDFVRVQPVATLAFACGVLVFSLPYAVDGGFVFGPRLASVFWWLLASSPRLPTARAARVIGGLGAGLCIAHGAFLVHATHRFEEEAIAPLVEVIEAIPGDVTDQPVGCIQHGEARPWFLRVPLDHACPALVHELTGAWSSPAFAVTAYNAIALREGALLPQLPRTLRELRREHLAGWRYLIVYGDHAPPSRASLAFVASAERTGRHPTRWTLYRVVVRQ